MTEMLLLGAGASREAGIPTTVEMTGRIVEQITWDRHRRALLFVLGGLKFQQGIRGANPLDEAVDVEALFNAVEILAERDTLDVAPFVGSWHSMVEELDREEHRSSFGRRGLGSRILGAVSDSLRETTWVAGVIGERRLDEELKRPHSSMGRIIHHHTVEMLKAVGNRLKASADQVDKDAEKQLSRLILEDRPGEGRIFREVNDLMVAGLRKHVWLDSQGDHGERLAYLRPILRTLQKQPHLCIATLNYDNTIELLASGQGRSPAQWAP